MYICIVRFFPAPAVNYTQFEDSNTQTTPTNNLQIHNFEYRFCTYCKSTPKPRLFLKYLNKYLPKPRITEPLYTITININLNSMKMNLTTSEKNRGFVRFLLMSLLLSILILPAHAQDRVTVSGQLTDSSQTPAHRRFGHRKGHDQRRHHRCRRPLPDFRETGRRDRLFVHRLQTAVAGRHEPHGNQRHDGRRRHDDRRSRCHRLRLAA